MKQPYQKICYEKNKAFRVYYGSGYVCNDEQSTPLHYDTDLTLTYLKKCRGTVKIEGKRYPVHDGDVILLNPTQIHRCELESGSFHERISVYVNKSVLENFQFEHDMLFDAFYTHRTHIIRAETVLQYGMDALAETIYALSVKQAPVNRILITCKIIELLAKLHEISSRAEYTPEFVTENATVNQTIQYINIHFRENIDCTHLAQQFYLSKHHLEHLFKKCVGVSLWEYVILRRISYFNNLMRKDVSVTDAAFQSGFTNYSNFYRLYKKHTGMTPSAYKKIARKA